MAGKELDASVIDPPKVVEESEFGLKEEAFQSQDNLYYAPEPTFNVLDHYSYTPHVELPVETKKPPKNTEQEEIFRKVKSLEQSLRNMQGLGGQVIVAYKDLCLFPDAFARHFHYNIEIVPDRLSLNKIEKKRSESFREYSFRWREQAARVNPLMEEDEMVEYFLQALEPTYFGHLISAIGKSFNEVVKMGGMVEDGIKLSKIMSYSAIKATTQAIQNCTGGVLGKKKKKDVAMIEVQRPEAPNINQNPLPANAETHIIEIVHKDGEPKKTSKYVMTIRASESKPIKMPIVTKATSSIAKELTDKLNDKPFVVVVKRFPDNVEAKQGKPNVIVPGVASKPVIIMEGARIAPVINKPVTQLPIDDTKVIPCNYKRVIVTYKGKEVEEEVNETRGLTRSGRCFALEELRKAKPLKYSSILVKKPVTKEEAEEFLRKIKVQYYSIVEQLRKAPAQISLLSSLIHTDEHRRALMKILNEAHVPDKITVNNLEKISNKIFEVNRITFSDDELPLEGTEHNRALYLVVKCTDSMVTRVLVDNGFSANICPLYSAQVEN
ncbi:uncharacterized protein [Nicotiana sylvestris]|uniref:uncharacterized protein n=1 Tax=Nicotiana sylvestris TaxID=4096 RepID=UPI00388CE555